jgi:hypothetical protein
MLPRIPPLSAGCGCVKRVIYKEVSVVVVALWASQLREKFRFSLKGPA